MTFNRLPEGVSLPEGSLFSSLLPFTLISHFHSYSVTPRNGSDEGSPPLHLKRRRCLADARHDKRGTGMTTLLSSPGLTGGSMRLCQRSGFPIDTFGNDRRIQAGMTGGYIRE
jgi:hypothetical protein